MHEYARQRQKWTFFTKDLEAQYFYTPREHIWQNEFEPPQVEFIYILDSATGENLTDSLPADEKLQLIKEIITYENYYENLTTHRCVDMDL